MSAEQLKQLQELYAVISDIQLTKYTYVAASVVLFWDIFLTFDLEVARVWKTRSSIGKYLFIFNRYIPPILFAFDLVFQLHPNPTLTFCRNSFLPSTVLGIFALGTVEFVLVLRTYALYHNKWLLGFLTFLCVGSTSTMAIVTIYLFKTQIIWPPPGSLPVVGCVSNCSAPICRTLLTVFWAPFFVLETLILGLTLWKSYISYTSIGASKSPFVSIIYRDGLIYYFVIMSISVTNLVVWVAAPITLSYLATSLMRSLQVTISSRLLLNIRGMLDRGYGSSTYQSTQISTIGYAPNPKLGAKKTGTSYTASTEISSYQLGNINPSTTWVGSAGHEDYRY